MTIRTITPPATGARTLLGVAALLAIAIPAAAQTPQFRYTYRTAASVSLRDVAENGTIEFPGVALGDSTVVTLIAENRGPTPWTITKLAVAGAGFSLESARDQAVNPASSIPVTIKFTPAAAGRVSGRLTFDLTNQTTAVSVNLFLDASGIAPSWTTSYIVQPSGNQTLIEAGGALPFPGTAINATAQAQFLIQNRGTGEGTIRNVTVSGESFSLAGLPLLPARVAADQFFRFNINFNPRTAGSHSGQLTVDFRDGDQRVYRLTGEAVAAAFSYEWTTDGAGSAVTSGGTLTLPEVEPGTPQTVAVTVRNTGNSAGDVRTVSLSGTGYALAPLSLPQTLQPGATLRFTFTFTARDAAVAEAALRVDDATFRVLGRGLGARWTFAARLGQVSTPVAAGATYTFPNTVVGGRSAVVTIQIKNEGNRAGSISGLTAGPAIFRIQTLPALPVTLEPNQVLEIPIQYAPTAVGVASGTLQVDDVSIGLRGIGDTPPDLPVVTFTGVSDSAKALDQPAVGIQLEETYPYDITGTLTAGFTSDTFVDDPAIQFASGGRTVDFRIPANSKEAIFGLSAPNVQFQTGTVAGSISLTAAFQVGSVRLSADKPVVKTLAIAADAPVIRDVRIGSQSAASFEVLITGYSPARSVSQLSLQFAGAAGAQLQTTTLDVNVDGPFGSWYQSAASRTFGSQFTVAVTIAVNGELTAVQSVTVRASNARGQSNTVTANLR
ncbi:MAG: choice-of-anchor D domain-containing protein [Bryobacteraceae bacterium]